MLVTAPSLETNYKYLFTSQLNQAIKQSDWWGYFGGFLLGKENLILNQNFVNELKLFISDSSLLDIIKLHAEHFQIIIFHLSKYISFIIRFVFFATW